MKRLVIVLVGFTLAISVNAQVKYNVKGVVPAKHPAKQAIIGYPDNGEYKIDTADIKEGQFEFSGTVSRPQLAQITLIIPRPAGASRRNQSSGNEDEAGTKNQVLFYMGDELEVVFDTAGNPKLSKGSQEQKVFNEYFTGLKAEKNADFTLDFFREKVLAQIKKYPDSYVSLDLLELFSGVIQPHVFEPMLTSLSKRMQNTEEGKKWNAKLELAKKFDIGQPSIDFTLNDTEGKPISLASYKGQYVLLDFWASWCAPCRAGHPELINIYNKFKGEKFEILAVSMDSKKDLWTKAIVDDKLPWKQVSDLKGAENVVAKMYYVSQIPQNLLINPKGVIVGRNLTGKSLEDKLAELLK